MQKDPAKKVQQRKITLKKNHRNTKQENELKNTKTRFKEPQKSKKEETL